MPRRLQSSASALAVLALVALALVAVRAPAADAAALHYSNPMRDAQTGKPLSCPDPSVIRIHRWKWNYFLFCTSDNARNAFPMWKSTDLVHWYSNGYVFPHGRQPAWAVPSDGRSRRGIYWAPSIERIANRWALYFSAIYNPASHAAGTFVPRSGTMVLGVATATSLAGPWHTKLLHYPGQLNAANAPPAHELIGGDIDPGVVQDPRTGARYLFWAEQREQIWEAQLSPDGLTAGPMMRLAFSVSEPWECDPADRECTVEGPQPFYRDGRIYVLYSGASTWDSSYVVGVASASRALDPALPFVKDAQPILQAGNGFLGPGGASAPVIGPDGQTMIMYHALTRIPSSHASAARVLMLGSVNWLDGYPLVNRGVPLR